MSKRLRILTWHVHGNYLYNLTQVPHDFYLLTDAEKSTHRSGRSGTLPWGDNVFDAPVERIQDMPFDVVLFQQRDAWDDDQHRFLTAAQRALPRIYLEHDPPQGTPTDTRHWVDDPNALLVHVTAFNQLMWDNGRTPTRVIEHGVLPLQQVAYSGERERGIVVVNNLDLRGRRLGLDVYRDVAARVPLTLIGMGSERIGGDGEVKQQLLAGVVAQHRFFFNPIRYTSLGLAVIEAMLAGVPVVALATTEIVSVIRDGENGFADTRIERLEHAMQSLLRDRGVAAAIGEAGRRTACERFGIERFVGDWLRVLREVAG